MEKGRCRIYPQRPFTFSEHVVSSLSRQSNAQERSLRRHPGNRDRAAVRFDDTRSERRSQSGADRHLTLATAATAECVTQLLELPIVERCPVVADLDDQIAVID